ncbi:acyltransferase family protein [Pseudomonas sp. NPDC087639]|uniref:acyltransferase family protein n=1 Tax=Pseudomonas sp. NPDC087639 TaxID=3364445 RepID=UPI00382EA385
MSGKGAYSSNHVGYRPDIDGLRAIAVLGVLFYHAFPDVLTGGFIGVDVFFVISGFIISSNLYKGLESNSFSFLDFYIRRVKRIFPALILVLSSVLLFGWFALFPTEYAAVGKHAAFGAGFGANFGYLGESGYFDVSAITKPLLHLWSLGIEEQFYLVWPVVLILAWRIGLNLFIGLAVLIVLSFATSICLIDSDQMSAFYLPYSRFWELMIGALIAAWAHFHPKKLASFSSRKVMGVLMADLLSVLGLACITLGYIYAKEDINFPGYWALLPTVGCGLVIVAGVVSSVNRNILANRVLVVIGLISFPLYLWHWPLLSYAHVIQGGTTPASLRAILAVTAIVMAWLTFRFVERPLRYGAGNYKTWGLIVAMICVGGFGWVIFQSNGFANRAAVVIQQETNALLVGPTWKYTKNDLCVSLYPGTFRYFCSQEKNEPPTLILIGNSYANHLYGGLVEDKRFARHNVLSYGSCQPGGYMIDCDMQEKIVADHPSIKYAIISALWPRFDEQGREIDMVTGQGPTYQLNMAAAYEKFLNDKVAFLRSHGVQTIIFGPKPEVMYDPRTCFTRPFASAANDCIVTKSQADKQQAGINEVIQRVKAKNPDVQIFDQNDLFCSGSECSLIEDGLPLLRDYRHYSEFGSRQIISRFADWAKTNAPGILE